MCACYPEAEIVQDVGPAFSFKRPGLRALLERLVRGDRLRIVATRRDRLAGAGADAIRFLAERNGGEILVLDPPAAEPGLAGVLAFIHE